MTSRTFEDLERRCKNIDKKRYTKWFLVSSAVFVFFVAFVFAYLMFVENKQVVIKSDAVVSRKNLPKEIKKPKEIIEVDEIIEEKKDVPQEIIEEKKEPSQEKIVKKEVEEKKSIEKEKILSKPKKKIMKDKKRGYDTIFLKLNIVMLETLEPNQKISKAILRFQKVDSRRVS